MSARRPGVWAGAEEAWSLAQVLSNQCIVDDDVPCNTLSYWEHQ